ncbi:uncharacterized protein J4E79_002409 [Alternaria viburni]|uniref:uncharacterized protein n=1 Tax=Alternaria viburni TaxID=566460 RepID=UPI0020C23457|nr:uncharacterized protein J4E79_002409 [Alternaria viburni]KAI4666371.1 hypothetical protein J4E79_002409 [Alternaria viburni]
MIFGGLEIVAGGYLIHRHYRKKNGKEQLEEEAQQRRHHTFPGANPAKQNGWNTQAHHRPQHHPQAQQQQPVVPQQKYACYAPVAAQPRPQIYQPQFQPQPQVQHQAQPQSRPHAPPHTQSFNIPRRPVPQRKPQIIIEPSLQRTDSFATISRMPIANGSRPHDVPEQASPAIGLSPIPQHGVYGNAGFSVSTPAFGATPTSPGLVYEMATGREGGVGQTVDDNWETYGGHAHAGAPHYAPTVSTELGERDPPPPYMP